MLSLSQNWITENHIDLEYKKYVVLAYLQQVDNDLKESKLFPAFSELKKQYRYLSELVQQKNFIFQQFPKALSEFKLKEGKCYYEQLVKDDEVMKTVQHIIDFSLPLFEKYLDDSMRMAQFVERNLSIHPVGIVPIRKAEGFFFLTTKGLKTIEVYQYQLSLFDDYQSEIPAMHLQWVATYEYTIVNTFEKVKQDLLLKQKELPNPATYCIQSDYQFPMMETLLPLAKVSLARHISQEVH